MLAVRRECDVREIASDLERSDALAVVWLSKLHLMPMPSDARWRLSVFRKVEGSTIVWLSDCCIRPWNNQMHADGCLLRKPVAVSWLQRHSRWSVGDFALNAEIVGCIDNFVCFFEMLKFNNCLLTQTKRLMFFEIADWLTDCKTNCWLLNNAD